MDSAVAVHAWGLGSSLWARCIPGWTRRGRRRSATRRARNALSVSSRNHRSTRLSHDDECRGEVEVEPRVFVQPCPDVFAVVGGAVVQDQVDQIEAGCCGGDSHLGKNGIANTAKVRTIRQTGLSLG